MDYEEITQTFRRTKALVKHVASRTVRVAVVADGAHEPVVLGDSSLPQAERFGELMEEAGFQPIQLGYRASQLAFDVLFVPAGKVATVLSRL